MRSRTVLIASAIVVVLVAIPLYFFAAQLFLYGFFQSPIHTLEHDANHRVNILLLGTGGASHASPDLTDAIMLVSLRLTYPPSASLLSIPRDVLIMNEQKESLGKINGLYSLLRNQIQREYPELAPAEISLRALNEARDYFSDRLSLPIHYVVKIDFSAFEQAIDAVGGIDIVVPKAIVDYSFPLDEGTVGLWSIDAGMQHLNGKEALRYARSRHGSTDFDRSARQQIIMKAVLDAVKQSVIHHPQSVASLYSLLSSHVLTNLSLDDIIAIARVARYLTHDRIVSIQLNYSSGGGMQKPLPGGFVYAPPAEKFGSAAVLLPISVSPTLDDWSQIQTLASFITVQSDAYIHPQRIEIREAEHQRHAYALRNELIQYGFSADVSNDRHKSASAVHTSLCASDPQAHDVSSFLSRILSIPIASPCLTAGSGGVIITLGADYVHSPIALRERKRLQQAQ